MRMAARKRRMEWGFLFRFFMFLVAWMLIGIPAMNWLTATSGAFTSYGVYLLLIGLAGYFFGKGFSNGIESVILFISSVLMVDIISPPALIQLTQEPSAEVLRIWGSDTFIYSLGKMLGLSHVLAWGLTYLVTPMLGVMLLSYFLSKKRLKKRVLSSTQIS